VIGWWIKKKGVAVLIGIYDVYFSLPVSLLFGSQSNHLPFDRWLFKRDDEKTEHDTNECKSHQSLLSDKTTNAN